MRVMVLSKVAEERPMTPTPEMMEAFAAMDRFMEELVAAGVFVAAAGLKPSAESKRIALEGGLRKVVDGPFGDTRGLVV